jgi:hypothetical protein
MQMRVLLLFLLVFLFLLVVVLLVLFDGARAQVHELFREVAQCVQQGGEQLNVVDQMVDDAHAGTAPSLALHHAAVPPRFFSCFAIL